MAELCYSIAKLLVTILLCLGGFVVSVLLIALCTKEVGRIIFGQRFSDWWDSNFWF